MDVYLLEQLINSVGIYYSISNNLDYYYSNIPSDFKQDEMLVKYQDKYYNRKIGFVTVGNVKYEIIAFSDVTEIKKQTMYDSKTGAMTLDYFKKNLDDMLSNGEVVLGLIDIDDFKSYNDTFGHHVGDEVLKKVVTEFQTILGPNDAICRFGGDEFILAIQSDDIDEVRNNISNLADKMRASFTTDNLVCMVLTFSIGLIKYNKEEDYDTNFKDVDSVMYFCKKNGKNAVVSKETYVKVLEK